MLRPAGHAASYDVTLFGRGQRRSVCHVPLDHSQRRPASDTQARLAVLAGHDGRVDSYGVELEIKKLAATPVDAPATITVRAENGRAITFDATRAAIQCLPHRDRVLGRA